MGGLQAKLFGRESEEMLVDTPVLRNITVAPNPEGRAEACGALAELQALVTAPRGYAMVPLPSTFNTCLAFVDHVFETFRHSLKHHELFTSWLSVADVTDNFTGICQAMRDDATGRLASLTAEAEVGPLGSPETLSAEKLAAVIKLNDEAIVAVRPLKSRLVRSLTAEIVRIFTSFAGLEDCDAVIFSFDALRFVTDSVPFMTPHERAAAFRAAMPHFARRRSQMSVQEALRLSCIGFEHRLVEFPASLGWATATTLSERLSVMDYAVPLAVARIGVFHGVTTRHFVRDQRGLAEEILATDLREFSSLMESLRATITLVDLCVCLLRFPETFGSGAGGVLKAPHPVRPECTRAIAKLLALVPASQFDEQCSPHYEPVGAIADRCRLRMPPVRTVGEMYTWAVGIMQSMPSVYRHARLPLIVRCCRHQRLLDATILRLRVELVFGLDRCVAQLIIDFVFGKLHPVKNFFKHFWFLRRQ